MLIAGPTHESDKMEYPLDPILCGVDRKCEPFSILISILLVDISHIHLERSCQRLHHSFDRSISLGSIGLGSTLLLTYDLAEAREKSDINSGSQSCPIASLAPKRRNTHSS